MLRQKKKSFRIRKEKAVLNHMLKSWKENRLALAGSEEAAQNPQISPSLGASQASVLSKGKRDWALTGASTAPEKTGTTPTSLLMHFKFKPCVVAHTCNPSMHEMGAGGFQV